MKSMRSFILCICVLMFVLTWVAASRAAAENNDPATIDAAIERQLKETERQLEEIEQQRPTISPTAPSSSQPVARQSVTQVPAAYNEDNFPPEGKLNDIFDKSRTGGGGSGAAGGRDAAMGQSDEYKRVHGRCSEDFSPIYFDYDSVAISSSMRSRMEANAAWLRSNAQSHVVIEGNTDARGTNEYNLAMGERRALTAKKYLISLGIDGKRIRTTSFGEERRLFEGTSEEDYAKNRRVDFIAE